MTSEASQAHVKSTTEKFRGVVLPESRVSSQLPQSREEALLLEEGAHLGCMASEALDWHVQSVAGRFAWCDAFNQGHSPE